MANETNTTSFATKYRPSSLDDYIGDSTVDTIKNIMSRNPSEWPHVWMLHGERGTGKTTLARILAKWYECENPTPEGPCGHCPMCQDIDENLIFSETGSEAYGVTEVNVATDNGKAAIMSIIDDAVIPPQYPLKYKVVIMDECHEASHQAQNALLKICEAPPKHLVIIFCTTDPDEMLETLYDRCTFKIRAKKGDAKQLLARLKKCCESEKITTSEAALKTIIKMSAQNPRKCFTTLEEIAKSNGNLVDLKAVEKRTDARYTSIYQGYFRAAKAGLGPLVEYTNNMWAGDVAPKDFLQGLCGFMLDCLCVRHGYNLDIYTKEFVKEVGEIFRDYNTQELDFLMQIIEDVNRILLSKGVTDDYIRLLVVTTGMRIYKTPLMAEGLANGASRAVRENQLGSREAINLIQKEYEESRPKNVDQANNSNLLLATFGKNITEVQNNGSSIGNMLEDDDEEDDTDDFLDYDSEDEEEPDDGDEAPDFDIESLLNSVKGEG